MGAGAGARTPQRKPLRVFYFTQLFYPLVYGGGEYLFFLLAREFAKRGNEVHVITQRILEAPLSEEHDGIQIHRVGPTVRYSGFLPPTLSSNFGYLTGAAMLGFRLMARTRGDWKGKQIIHSNTYFPAFAGALCSRLYRIPHVVTFHDIYQTSGRQFWSDWMGRLGMETPSYAPALARLVEDFAVKTQPTAFHAVSETTKEDLISFGADPGRVVVIPNGVSESDYRADVSRAPLESKRVAVFIGRLIFYKNIDTVIRGFERLAKSNPDTKLVLIGDGPDRARLAAMAKPLGDRVVFKGLVSAEEKARILSESSFVVFPSLVEGFGITVIEAFAAKKTVLVSAVRPMSDIVSDGKDGYVLPPFDSDAWAGRMSELFNDPSKARSMGEAAFRTFESKYKLGRVVDELEGLYRRMMPR